MEVSPLSPSAPSAKLMARARSRAPARLALSAMANSSGSPDSRGNCRAMRAKKLSMVLRPNRPKWSIIWRSNSQHSAEESSGVSLALAKAANFFLSLAASDSRTSNSSRNSPADLRVKVSAAIRSMLTPARSKRMMRVVRANVFPLPALATSISWLKVSGRLKTDLLLILRWSRDRCNLRANR